ncbi:Non-catalytic module family DOC2, partial [Piromyces sp. E2]
CWSAAEGYKCCSDGVKVELTDSKGKWGIENGEWCGIVNEPTPDPSCWASAQGYKCCQNTCDAIYSEGSQKWGFENNDWCGI